MKSAQAKGIPFSNHNDFSVTPLDPMRMIWSSVTRKSKTGVVIGPDECVDVMTAIKALTIVPAWHYREEASKGSIEVGKLADLVILDKNPLTARVDDIPGIAVLATYKEGRKIYEAGRKTGTNDVIGPFRRQQAQAGRFIADEGRGPIPGCACCVNGLPPDVAAAAAREMTAFAASPLLA